MKSKIKHTDRYIEIKGARANNLRNVNLKLHRGDFIVVTGVSGSGKSSLAFDTLYAEGRRRYVESLSAYARQFMGRMPKPECDYIKGLPPAIAIEQKVGSHNPRSTVGTATEIHDYLRLLFARIGRTYSPISGREVHKDTVDAIVTEISSLPQGTRVAVTSPVTLPENRTLYQQFDIYLKEGYSRLEHNGDFVDIADVLNDESPVAQEYYNLLIDRLSIDNEKDTLSRLTDSIETAYYEGHDTCIIKSWEEPGAEPRKHVYSKKFSADGIDFREPTELMFNFNNPYGACTRCEGFGHVLGIREELVVPDPTKSVYNQAVVCWRGEKMSEWLQWFASHAEELNFPLHKPYAQLSKEEHDILWHGRGEWPGIDGFFRWVDENQYKIQYRVMKARFRGRSVCPVCHGTRLKPDVEYVKIGGRSITELLDMPVCKLRAYFDTLELSETDALTAARLLSEIRSRLQYLDEVGLGYLTLSRQWNTLSGGESQRIKLSTALGSSLVGSLYVLDEPTIGLHPRDNDRLTKILHRLRDMGNTLVVVEHDEDIMRSADTLVDVGPDAGSLGGQIVYSGSVAEALQPQTAQEYPESKTLQYLGGNAQIPIPTLRRPHKDYIEIIGARQNNLKDVDVRFPLGIMTCVTGVSGSGKSTLVHDILYRILGKELHGISDTPGYHVSHRYTTAITDVEYIDQNPVGTSTRSNAVTYLGIYDEIRRLYSMMPLARQLRYTPSYFSFNTDGGRCEECKGEGVITIPMQFMADIQVPCEVCGGKRFKQEILDVRYRDKSIYDILQMKVSEAAEFFAEDTESATARRITRALQPLLDVGLGYVALGQNSSTFSGGENQRLKLAYYLSTYSAYDKKIFILDEPTTGLHTADIATLMSTLNRIVDLGNTVIIIEHNLHVIKCADHIIDLGPEGGDAGGMIVAEGTPEQIAACPNSLTGKYLRPLLQ